MSTDDGLASHLRILKDRFSERRLLEAARRREHLGYRVLHIGDAPGSGKVRFLLAQMHQNYYFGFYETVCALGGIILEQALMYRLKRLVRERAPIRIRTDRGPAWIQTPGDLFLHGVSVLLRLAYDERLLRGKRIVQIAHHLRWIRNMVIHEALPLFAQSADGTLEMRVIRSRSATVSYATIRMKSAETAGLTQKRGETTAFYCISRLREVLEVLLRTEQPKNGASNESSDSLFQWQEATEGT
jgi:hypothetical protein